MNAPQPKVYFTLVAMPVANHLRRHRLAMAEMTPQALADRAGVTRQTIIAIEKGNYNPSVELALRLAGIFGVHVEDLFQLHAPSRGRES